MWLPRAGGPSHRRPLGRVVGGGGAYGIPECWISHFHGKGGKWLIWPQPLPDLSRLRPGKVSWDLGLLQVSWGSFRFLGTLSPVSWDAFRDSFRVAYRAHVRMCQLLSRCEPSLCESRHFGETFVFLGCGVFPIPGGSSAFIGACLLSPEFFSEFLALTEHPTSEAQSADMEANMPLMSARTAVCFPYTNVCNLRTSHTRDALIWGPWVTFQV